MSRIEPIHSHSRRVCGFSGIAVVGLACLTLVSLIFGQQTFVGAHGRLSVKGNKLSTRTAIPPPCMGCHCTAGRRPGTQYFNTSAINHLAQDWKCTVIRIAILPKEYKNDPTSVIDRSRP